jgi:hypothetical protein
VSISDQIKTNIFTGVNLERTYDPNAPYPEEAQLTANTNQGTAAFYLGYNSLLPATIKTTSANMTSRSVIVQLQAPFYRVYCDLPLDTMSYLTDGSLSCVGYMTKNYQSQSFIYSFASDYGGYLTRDVLLTNLRTEIRNPKGLLVSSLDPNSAIFYKVVRNIQIEPGLTSKQEGEQAKQLLERQEQEAKEETEQRTINLDVIKNFKQILSNLANTNDFEQILTNIKPENTKTRASRGKKNKLYTTTTGNINLLTEKQREKAERKEMLKEDKERRGRPSRKQLHLRETEGKETSLLRQKGREMLEQKIKVKQQKTGGSQKQ